MPLLCLIFYVTAVIVSAIVSEHRVYLIDKCCEIRLTHQRDEITLQKAQLILPRTEIGKESPGEGSVSPTTSADSGATRAVAGHRGSHRPRSRWGLWNLWKPEAL